MKTGAPADWSVFQQIISVHKIDFVGQAAQTQTCPVLLSSPSWLQGKCGFPGEVLLLQLHAPLTI